MPAIEMKTEKSAREEYNRFLQLAKKGFPSKSAAAKAASDIFMGIVISVASHGFFDVYKDMFDAFRPHLEVNENILKNVKYLITYSISKKQYTEAMYALLLLNVDKLTDASLLRDSFSCYTKYCHSIFCYGNLSNELKTKYFSALGDLAAQSIKMDEQAFTELNNLIFNDERSRAYVLKPSLSELKPFFAKYMRSIHEKENVKDLDAFFKSCMLVLVNLLQHIDEEAATNSLALMKTLTSHPAVVGSKYYKYASQTYYGALKVFSESDAKSFATLLKDVLSKFTKLLECNKVDEAWFKGFVVAVVKMLESMQTKKKDLFNALSPEDSLGVFKILQTIVLMMESISYENALYSCCTSLRKHLIFDITGILLNSINVLVTREKQGNISEHFSALKRILKYSVKISTVFECPNLKYVVRRFFSVVGGMVRGEKSPEQAKMILAIFETIWPMKHFSEYMGKYNFVVFSVRLHRVLGPSAARTELLALKLAHAIASKMDMDSLKQFALDYYQDEKRVALSDKLEKKDLQFKPDSFDKRRLLEVEIEIMPKAKHSSVVVGALLRHATNDVEYMLVARNHPVESTKELLKKYEELSTRVKKTATAEEYLAFGYLCKILAIQSAEKMRGILMVTKFNEGNLTENIDIAKLKQMDLSAEMKIVSLAAKSIDAFSKFFELTAKPLNISIDWVSITDDVSMLARIMHLRGYLDKAYTAWHLVFRIATVIDDSINQIRCLSFFCENYNFICDFDKDFDFSHELGQRHDSIINALQDIHTLVPRRQNYVLTCVLHIAYYYYATGDDNSAAVMFKLVEHILAQLNRQNKFEVVRCTYYAIHFRIMSRHPDAQVSPIVYAHEIFEQLKHRTFFTSEDSINLPTSCFGLIIDIANYLSIRLCANLVTPYLSMLMQSAFENGCAFRIVQVLGMWSVVNLQCEEAAKVPMKMNVVDVVLGKKKTFDVVVDVKVADVKSSFENMQALLGALEVDQVRRVAKPMSVVPTKVYEPQTSPALEPYMVSHAESCSCQFCISTFLKWQLFQLDIIQARTSYLANQFDALDAFYKSALKWWKRKHPSHMKGLHKEIGYLFLCYFMNLLRRKKASKAIGDLRKLAITFYEDHLRTADIAFKQNIVSQTLCLSVD